MVNMGHNSCLIKYPTKEEVKQAVLGLNGQSAGGQDGFIGVFYQSCCDIIGDDILTLLGHSLMVKIYQNVSHIPIWCFYLRKRK